MWIFNKFLCSKYSPHSLQWGFLWQVFKWVLSSCESGNVSLHIVQGTLTSRAWSSWWDGLVRLASETALSSVKSSSCRRLTNSLSSWTLSLFLASILISKLDFSLSTTWFSVLVLSLSPFWWEIKWCKYSIFVENSSWHRLQRSVGRFVESALWILDSESPLSSPDSVDE